MVDHERWQLDGSAPELYQRYLVPAITSLWAAELVEQARPRPYWTLRAALASLPIRRLKRWQGVIFSGDDEIRICFPQQSSNRSTFVP